MAELLIRLEQKNEENGYVVTLQPDGWGWGERESLPTYGILKVPDASVEELTYLGELDLTEGKQPRRRHQMSPSVVNKMIKEGGIMTLNWKETQNIFKKII